MRHRTASLFLVWTMLMQLVLPATAAPRASIAPSPPAASTPSSSASPALPNGVRFVTTVEGISEYTLANGLRVLLFPDDSVSNVTVNITYLVGSRNENYGETGMAHLLEHLLFKGSKSHPNITQELSEHGAQSNGTTWLDRTNYYETMEASDANLTWALELEADRMVNSFIAKKDLDKEMTVVRNEFERGENEPGAVMVERAMETAFLWHNYGNPTIGARSDIENVPIERLQAFYRTYYQPDNAMLVVAGRFDPQPVLQTIARVFGPIARPSRALPAAYTKEPAQDGEREIVLRRVGDSQDVAAFYHVPAGSHADFAPIDVFVQLMGDSPGGRLYNALVDTHKATGVGGSTYQLHDPGVAYFAAEMRVGTPLAPARTGLVETVEDGVRKTPITAAEVERAKNAILKQIELSLNNTERVGKELTEWQAMGDWRLFFLYRDALRKVTVADCQRVAEKYFRASNRTLAMFIPSDKVERVMIPDAPDVQALVAGYKGDAGVVGGERFDASPLNIEKRVWRVKTPGGVMLALLPKKTRGSGVRVSLTLRFGDVKELQGKSAVADLTAAMLNRGTARHTRQQIKDELDRLKARVSVGGGATNVSVQIETLRDNLPAVMTLVAEILREPVFPQNEFEQLKQECIADAEQGRSDPQVVASTAMSRHLYPYPADDVRHIDTPEEEIAAYQKVTLDDVKAFYKAFYGANVGQCAAVGDFHAEGFPTLFNDLFGEWKSARVYARVPHEFFKVAPLDRVLETPDKENAVYLAGIEMPMTSDDPDYPAMMLGNYLLGGGFLNSRLAVRLRQQMGVSYGAGSSFTADPFEKTAAFKVYAIFAPQNEQKVRQAVREVLETALKEGFTEKEVEAARSGLLQGRQVERAKDASLVGRLLAYEYIGRSMMWDEDFDRTVRKLTAAQVLDVLRRRVDLSQITVVTAGDFTGKGSAAPAAPSPQAVPKK